MMQRIYTFGIQLYGYLMAMVALFHPKAKKWREGRKGILREMKAARQAHKSSTPLIWFHAASLGEFEQGRPVLEALKSQAQEKNIEIQILLTFFSPSGYEVQKDYAEAEYVFYLPLDSPLRVKAFLDIFKPKAAFFIKYEFWFNYLRELDRRSIPTILFSALFEEQDFFFQWYGKYFQKYLHGYERIFVQNPKSQEILIKHGLENSEVAGDTRFDRVIQNTQEKEVFSEIETFKADEALFIVGSAWGGDLDILLPFLREVPESQKTIIAPHEIQEKTLLRIETYLADQCLRYSELVHKSEAEIVGARVLIIDNIGILARLYAYADFAYVGGGFGEGLHNILEPAAFGVPVFIGQEYQGFPEAEDLVQLGGLVSLTSSEHLKESFEMIYSEPKKITEMGRINREYVMKHQGGKEKIIHYFWKTIGQHL